jgi:hypothetical protein
MADADRTLSKVIREGTSRKISTRVQVNVSHTKSLPSCVKTYTVHHIIYPIMHHERANTRRAATTAYKDALGSLLTITTHPIVRSITKKR